MSTIDAETGRRRPATPDRHRLDDGHHDRVLRLLHLCHGRDFHLSAPVLPQGQPHHRAAGLAGDVRSGLRGAPGGINLVRALRRSCRAQGDASRLAADHGDRHLRHRIAADLPAGGRRGAGAVGGAAVRSGPRVGRRVERSGAAGHRDRRTRQAGEGGDVATVGRAVRFPAGKRAVPDTDRLAGPQHCRGRPGGPVPHLGMADPVPLERGHGGDWAVCQAATDGDAGVRQGTRAW